MENISLFDFFPDAEKFKPKKSSEWKWSFKDYPKDKNGLKVFSCFACGGGSTMGYKLAGCDVIGCCEIDPKMNEVYIKNHNPKHNFLMDIRAFNLIPNSELPNELFNLDILDGSPPCTTFSMGGQREDSWGEKKKFREGQVEQTLDDLPFVFIDTVKKLKPKVMIMENVEGLLLGAAWSYVQRIYKQLNDIGYTVKHWLLKGETMGVPQTRHRVFFVAVKKELGINLEQINMAFNYAPVSYGEIKEGCGRKLSEDTDYFRLTLESKPTDKKLADVNLRLHNKSSGFQCYLIDDNSIIPTQRSKPDIIDRNAISFISKETIRNAQTFPCDYDFGSNSYSSVGYICGMSVPPLMIKRLVIRLIEQGVFNYKNE